ncbi:DUF3545 family protein [Colwellia sp. UCD-KL20]|uniref:DUF3545 family protein n=1 Tax=Colwellia sp. UCD-KL20 TaxID=1917165 RepID=UPI0025704838|nr:DUF3545 family protein [Colwellia sp. UCD-KL20]
MANYDLNGTEELFNEETNMLNSKLNTKGTKRKWREIESFKEKQRLRRELLEYSQYGL